MSDVVDAIVRAVMDSRERYGLVVERNQLPLAEEIEKILREEKIKVLEEIESLLKKKIEDHERLKQTYENDGVYKVAGEHGDMAAALRWAQSQVRSRTRKLSGQ